MLRASGQSLADWCRVLYKLRRLVTHHCVNTRCLALSCTSSWPRHFTSEFWSDLLLSLRGTHVMLRCLASTFISRRYEQALVNPILFSSYSCAFYAISWFRSSSVSLISELAWSGDSRCPGIRLQLLTLMDSLGARVFHLAGFRVMILLRVGLHVGDLR